MDSTANAAEPSLAEQKAEFDAAGGELPATLTPEQFQQCVEEMDRLTPEEFQDWRRRCDALKRRGDAVKTRSIADWRLCSLGQHGHASHEPSALTAAPVVIAASAVVGVPPPALRRGGQRTPRAEVRRTILQVLPRHGPRGRGDLRQTGS
jgi:hypothetical protein